MGKTWLIKINDKNLIVNLKVDGYKKIFLHAFPSKSGIHLT